MVALWSSITPLKFSALGLTEATGLHLP